MSSGLMVSVHRHRTELRCAQSWIRSCPGRNRFWPSAWGSEIGNPPSKFVGFFREARDRGFRTTVHAGEEGPASYVREALDFLHVDRIDHGNACLSDASLTREIADRRIALTVCPLSNLRLKLVPRLSCIRFRPCWMPICW